MYQPREIEDIYSTWRAFFKENDDRGEACINYVFGDQWDGGIIQDRALRGEESFVFNLAHKHLLRVKGEGESLELSLTFSGGNLDPKQLKEGQHVLKKMILCNDHLSAFKKVLNQVYDYGYGVLQVGTRQCGNKAPFEEPFLRVINNPTQAFFDVQSEDDFKTEGRYCGLKYKMSAKSLLLGERDDHKAENKQICDVIDFWYRQPREVQCYLDQSGKWHETKISNPVIKKKVVTHDVFFMRIIDGKITQEPVKYYTQTKLPLVYWKGLEGEKRHFDTRKVKTLPFVYPIVDAQTMVNYVGSSIVGRLKKLGGTKVVVTDQMIEGKENFWSDYNRRSGVIQVNESDEGGMQQPLVLPPDTLDATLLNAMQSAIQIMDQLAGINPAMQGQQRSVTTNAGLHTQIMQGNLLQNVVLSNHLRAINEVGRILKEMIPEVVIEQRDIGDGFVLNQRGKKYTPSNPEIRNDVRELFSEMMFEIVYGASSEAEKSANLMAIKEIIQTNPNIAPYFADEFAANLNTANSENLTRRMKALMPAGIEEVGDGSMTLEEYRQMQQEQQQNQPPSPQEQQMEMQKQKMQGDQQLKQAELQLKKQKMEQQAKKDEANLQIKAAGVVAKAEPKEMIYEKESKGANRKS